MLIELNFAAKKLKINFLFLNMHMRQVYKFKFRIFLKAKFRCFWLGFWYIFIRIRFLLAESYIPLPLMQSIGVRVEINFGRVCELHAPPWYLMGGGVKFFASLDVSVCRSNDGCGGRGCERRAEGGKETTNGATDREMHHSSLAAKHSGGAVRDAPLLFPTRAPRVAFLINTQHAECPAGRPAISRISSLCFCALAETFKRHFLNG